MLSHNLGCQLNVLFIEPTLSEVHDLLVNGVLFSFVAGRLVLSLILVQLLQHLGEVVNLLLSVRVAGIHKFLLVVLNLKLLHVNLFGLEVRLKAVDVVL